MVPYFLTRLHLQEGQREQGELFMLLLCYLLTLISSSLRVEGPNPLNKVLIKYEAAIIQRDQYGGQNINEFYQSILINYQFTHGAVHSEKTGGR